MLFWLAKLCPLAIFPDALAEYYFRFVAWNQVGKRATREIDHHSSPTMHTEGNIYHFGFSQQIQNMLVQSQTSQIPYRSSMNWDRETSDHSRSLFALFGSVFFLASRPASHFAFFQRCSTKTKLFQQIITRIKIARGMLFNTQCHLNGTPIYFYHYLMYVLFCFMPRWIPLCGDPSPVSDTPADPPRWQPIRKSLYSAIAGLALFQSVCAYPWLFL